MEEKKAALVTGASSGIGKAIAYTLCAIGYIVVGIGRTFAKEEMPDAFVPIELDLMETQKLEQTVRILRKEYDFTVLVNNAGVGYYGLHEELNAQKIRQMVRTNLEAPMILTQLLLRDLKKHRGTIINISSVTAERSNPHGCAYGATKAGLSSFAHSLFDEARKYGVRVINIQPDMTNTNLYRHADFTCGEETETHLEPKEVAETVAFILTRRERMVITDVTIEPQKVKIQKKLKKENRP